MKLPIAASPVRLLICSPLLLLLLLLLLLIGSIVDLLLLLLLLLLLIVRSPGGRVPIAICGCLEKVCIPLHVSPQNERVNPRR